MTRMNLNSPSTTTIAVAADYADAMMTARRAKNWLFILLLLVLLTQIALFFLLKFNVLRLGDEVTVGITQVTATTSPVASTQSADAATQPALDPTTTASTPSSAAPDTQKSGRVEDILRYVIPVTDFLGIALVVILAVVLLLIVTIMLVGRLIGVSHVTSAFIWCVLLTVLLFPWQSFLIGERSAPRAPAGGYGSSAYATDTGMQPQPTFKIPGVLYTWEELRYDVRHFPDNVGAHAILKWARYAGFPIVALLLLLMVQAKSSRGLKYALGESEVQVEVSTSRV
jgi:hypothetical protein